MVVYLDILLFLNFFVDFLLLLGTNRLAGHPPQKGRAAFAAALGGVYGIATLLPGFLTCIAFARISSPITKVSHRSPHAMQVERE